MTRKLNVVFGFLLVVLFITEANVIQQWHILLAILLSSAFSAIAFLFRLLTLDGMFAAILVGIYVLGFGGWPATILLLLFFISSAIISTDQNIRTDLHPGLSGRSGNQVWANGFWLVVMLILAAIFDAPRFSPLFLTGAAGAIATATSDTWGTEVGLRFSKSSYLITDLSKVSAGTDGGISFPGTAAALLGSLCIAFASVYLFSLNFYVFICILTAGFLGSIADSYFGAIFQRDNGSAGLPITQKSIIIDNNVVNALSTGVGALLTIILNLLFL